MNDLLSDDGIAAKSVFEYVRKMNQAIRKFLEAYLKIKSGKIKLNRKTKRGLTKKSKK